MPSHLRNPPVIQHNNFIRRSNCGQTVGNDEGGFAVGLFE